MRLEAALKGDLIDLLKQERAAAFRAFRATGKEVGKGLRDDLKKHTRAKGLGKFANRWTFRVNRPRHPMGMSVAVFPRSRATRAIIDAFDTGGIVRAGNAGNGKAKGRRFLAIPTPQNRRGKKVRFELKDLKDTFVQPLKDGSEGYVVFARVRHAQRRDKRGRVRDMAFTADQALLAGGQVRASKKLLAAGGVPLFVLKPQVRMQKRLDIKSVVAPWPGRIAGILVRNWEVEARDIKS